jgi:hypothetical protein
MMILFLGVMGDVRDNVLGLAFMFVSVYSIFRCNQKIWVLNRRIARHLRILNKRLNEIDDETYNDNLETTVISKLFSLFMVVLVIAISAIVLLI